MNIKKSLEDLPRSNHEHDGTKPSSNPFVGEALAELLMETEDPEHPNDLALAIPEAGPYRGSYASKRCDRALWYALTGTEQSNPPDAASQWTFKMGHAVHDMVQSVANRMFPDDTVDIEKLIDLRPIGIPGSSHADLIIRYKTKRTLIEMKSINGFSFKRCATTFQGAPEGPRSGHVMQAALAAKAEECENLVIVYFSLENVSPNLAKNYTTSAVGRFTAEWHYTVAELEPIIAAEVERIQRLVTAATEAPDQPVARRLIDHGIPDNARITQPESGLWVALESPGSKTVADTGDTWMCAYCDWKDRCITDGA